MSTAHRYDQIHMFFDESGSFQNEDIRLVGGVVVLGPYDQAADEQLLQILRQSIAACSGSGRFPRDLHFSASLLDRNGKRKLCQILNEQLAHWQGNQREVYGIALAHEADIFRWGNQIIAEREQDNRYLQMLSILIEYVCFLDPTIQSRLSPDAEVNIYVGQRFFPVNKTRENRNLLESLGYEFFEPAELLDQYLVKSITQRELLGLIRATVREHWPHSQLRFRAIGVLKIEYNHVSKITSPSALYLADLQLGCQRWCLGRTREPYGIARQTKLLPYGPKIQHLLIMKSALESGRLNDFLERAEQFFGEKASQDFAVPGASSALEEAVKHLKTSAVQLTQENPDIVAAHLRKVCQIVDEPGHASMGIKLADFLVEILRQAERSTPEIEVLALQAQLSAANHMGEREIADYVWERYLQMEDALLPLGLRGMELMAEMRNRRAVSLLDQFRFHEAKLVLANILNLVESGLNQVAHAFGIPLEQVPVRLIGTLYGTLGQICALQSSPDVHRAETCFRKALACFSETSDRERQWIYLGHLACDQAEQGHSLWQEVCDHLPELYSLTPIGEEGKQYWLALQIKGVYVYRKLAELLQFLQNWAACRPLDQYPRESFALHPFGLIYQGLGLLYSRVWQETRNAEYAQQALDWFDHAAQHLEQGGPLLKVLSRLARLRRWLVKAELPGYADRSDRRLAELLQGLRGYLAENYGEYAWAEGPDGWPRGHFGRFDPGSGYSWRDRAKAILQAVRFNYW